MSTAELIPPSDALLCRVVDPAVRADLQTFPFGTGPDHVANVRALETLRSCMEVRRPTLPASVIRRPASELRLPDAQVVAAQRLALTVGFSEATWKRRVDDFGWKMTLLPADAETVMVFGCGAGTELLFLRAAFPHARLLAHDWNESGVDRRILAITGAHFVAGDFVARLESMPDDADVIFSNHVLEHMFDPEAVLGAWRARLGPRGRLVSALPLDAMSGGPTTDLLLALALDPGSLHPLDLLLLNPGHCWKTNPPDLAATLAAAGFTQHSFHQRSDFLSRDLCAPRAVFEKQKQRARFAYRALFRAPELAARRISSNPSWAARKLWFAAQSRSPFGASRLQQVYGEEIAFSAVR